MLIGSLSRRSAVSRVLRARSGNLFLEAVADRQQLGLGDDVLAALLEVVLVDVRLDDRIDRAGFLAETAEDALEQIDVVARGAALAVGARRRIDGDRQRRADRLAQLAGDAALLAVRVATQRVQTAETVRLGDVLLRIAHRELGLEHVLHGQAEAAEQFQQQQAFEIAGDARHGQAPGVTMWKYFRQPATSTHTIVIGMNTFQPRRMIWS